MKKKHRVRVVAAGLLLMASLTSLPVTSGAFPIKCMLPPEDVYVGDPDTPIGGNRQVMARQDPRLQIQVIRVPILFGGLVVFIYYMPVQPAVRKPTR